jgi:hypothetical protein
MNRTQATLALVGVFLLLGLMGRMDYEDAKAEEANYCEMVKAKLWPDFRGTYRRECRR